MRTRDRVMRNDFKTYLIQQCSHNHLTGPAYVELRDAFEFGWYLGYEESCTKARHAFLMLFGMLLIAVGLDMHQW